MEKKTAIISCYFQPNYGSALQALATQMALDKLGIPNETVCIDGLQAGIRRAKAAYFAKAALTSDILLSKAGMALARIRRTVSKDGGYARMIRDRQEAFRAFQNESFRLSEAYGSLDGLAKASLSRYGAVLVGSDQLWLPANIAAGYYTLEWVPEGINTIAYATSFGQARLPSDSARTASRFLPRIRHLSVRELEGQRLVRSLTGRRIPVVADPTLLFTGEEWGEVRGRAPGKGGYIFCYFLGNNPLHRAFAKRLSEASGLRIIALPHVDEYVRSDEGYADETPGGTGPGEFLELIRNAEWVLTDSYHCTSFSIIYEKSFFTFRRYTRRTLQSTNGRLDSLLAQCGLLERMLTGAEDAGLLSERRIDYGQVRLRIEKLRGRSWRYLREALADRAGTDLIFPGREGRQERKGQDEWERLS